MKSLKLYSVLLLVMWLITSCEKEKNTGEMPVSLKGVFVINEGAFGQSNGDISFISENRVNKNINLFLDVNNRPLGDVVQSMTIIDNKGYIVVNNSQKIEIVKINNFKSIGVINGFASPRYILKVNNSTAYVSDWNDNNIKIINLATNSITGTIPTGNGPEQMIKVNDKVYVANVGGFGNDSTVTVINTLSNSVDTSFIAGINPNSLQLDADGVLWILCGGTLGPDFTPATSDDIGGKLIKVDPATNAIILSFNFSQYEHPLKLAINDSKTKLYFLRGSSAYTGNVCSMEITTTTLPGAALINREFYGFGINPSNENIYGSIGSFSANSYVLQYKNNGALVDSTQVGIGPNGFVFNLN